jgi:prohibitin 2
MTRTAKAKSQWGVCATTAAKIKPRTKVIRMDETDNTARVIKWALGVVGLIVLMFLIFGSFYIVGAGERGVLLTFGKPTEQPQEPGLHFKIPVVQSVVLINTQTQKYETDASAASSDLQIVATKVAVNYKVNADAVVTLYKEVGAGFETKIIQPATQESVKASTAQFTAEQLITRRDNVKQIIDDTLRERLIKYGIVMETTSITDFDFSAQFNAAIENKVTMEQNSLTEQRRLEMIQFQAQQAIAAANGTAQSVILKANADAEARLVVATAEAKALELQNKQVTEGVLQLRSIEVQKEYAQRWNGQLPQTILGGNAIPLLNMQLSPMQSTNTSLFR